MKTLIAWLNITAIEIQINDRKWSVHVPWWSSFCDRVESFLRKRIKNTRHIGSSNKS